MAQVASVSHEGVSCDGCMMPNFSGCRYKCLRCWDFDLCHACYTNDRFQVEAAADQQHDKEHPMQCILSHHDFELFYADDETRNYQVLRIAVITCPYCSRSGFSANDFYDHVIREHEQPKPYQVNCPLCIGLVDVESNRVVDHLKNHMASVHFQFDRSIQDQLAPARAVPAVSTIEALGGDGPPLEGGRMSDAALRALSGALGGPGLPFELPPRNGARRPMMARRAARQQPTAERTDRENRTENREQRQQAAAAAAFGMPWTENDEVQDLFRLARNAPDPLRVPAPNDRGVRYLYNRNGAAENTATLQQAAPGHVIANAEFLQRIIGTDPNVNPSYSLVRGINAEGAGEYASPRAHGAAVAPRSRTPPVNVVVGLGSRPMTSNHYEQLKLEDLYRERSPSVSTLTSGDAEGTEDEGEEGTETGDERVAEAPRSLNTSSSSESVTKEEKGTTVTRTTAEDDMLEALTRDQAILDTTLTQEEIVDMRRGEDPFAVRVVDPLKALLANATPHEWYSIKELLKDDDLRVRDEATRISGNAKGRVNGMDELGDSDDEIIVDDLAKRRPPGPKDEEDYRSNWLSVRMDTSGLSFARDSYWKDKRFITPRKLERQNSTATVDDAVLARNALKAISITRNLAGGKVLAETSGLSQGEEMRETLALWDMRKIERIEEGRQRQIARQCDESMENASRELDFDYDSAMLTVMKKEYEKLEKELSSQIGSPSSASASARLEKQKKYLEALRLAGAGGTVVLQNPRDDPAEQEELQRRLQQLWGTTPAATQEAATPQPDNDRPGPSRRP